MLLTKIPMGKFIAKTAIVLIPLALIVWALAPLVVVNHQVPAPVVNVEQPVGASVYSKQIAEVGTSTTSPILLAPNATWRGWVSSKTLQGDVRDVEDLRLNIAYKASTTAAVLNWNYYYSTNGVDWYAEGAPSTTGYTTTHATGTNQTWAMDSVSTQYKSIAISDVSAPFFKVVFDAATASGSLYAELVKRGN